jgi:probable addiction module antidote protein
MNKPALRHFDAAEFLRDEGDMTSYLAAAFEEGDVDLIRGALNAIAHARGMTALAGDTGLMRDTLYKALGDKGNPTLTTLLAISKKLSVNLSVAA